MLYLVLMHFIVDFARARVTVGENLLLNFLVFDRLRTPVNVEAGILSYLILFYN